MMYEQLFNYSRAVA